MNIRPIIIDEEDVVNCCRFGVGGKLYFKAVHRVMIIRDMSLWGKTERKILYSHYTSNLPCADFATLLYCIRENRLFHIVPRRIAHYFERNF